MSEGPVAFANPPQTITVLPQEIDLVIYEGDDFFMDMIVTDANSQPVDVTNAQPMSQIRDAPDGNLLASLVITVDTTQTNLMHIQLQAADSNGLPANCAWDIQLSSPTIVTLARGTVQVHPQVTL